MTKEEFTKIFSENPASDSVMEEINRLYQFEAEISEKLPKVEAEREEYKTKLNEANERYIKRFLSGPDADQPKNQEPDKKVTIESLFKEG